MQKNLETKRQLLEAPVSTQRLLILENLYFVNSIARTMDVLPKLSKFNYFRRSKISFKVVGEMWGVTYIRLTKNKWFGWIPNESKYVSFWLIPLFLFISKINHLNLLSFCWNFYFGKSLGNWCYILAQTLVLCGSCDDSSKTEQKDEKAKHYVSWKNFLFSHIKFNAVWPWCI